MQIEIDLPVLGRQGRRDVHLDHLDHRDVLHVVLLVVLRTHQGILHCVLRDVHHDAHHDVLHCDFRGVPRDVRRDVHQVLMGLPGVPQGRRAAHRDAHWNQTP